MALAAAERSGDCQAPPRLCAHLTPRCGAAVAGLRLTQNSTGALSDCCIGPSNAHGVLARPLTPLPLFSLTTPLPPLNWTERELVKFSVSFAQFHVRPNHILYGSHYISALNVHRP